MFARTGAVFLTTVGYGIAALAIEKVNPNFAREYAKLPDHVLKRIGEVDRSLAHEVIVGKPERE